MGVLEEYENLIAGTLTQYMKLSEEIGGPVVEQSLMVKRAFLAQREFLHMALCTPKPPTMEELQSLLQPTSLEMDEIRKHREMNRTSNYFNHLSAVSEAIAILGWVLISPDSAGYAKELHGAGAYYAHKVMTANKDKNTPDVQWARTWLSVLLELHKFILQHYRNGLAWNTQPSLSCQAYGAPPLPPPPPPAEIYNLSEMKQAVPGSDSRSALLKDINKGADITKCLKKVDRSAPPGRAAMPVAAASQRDAPIAVPKKFPPKLELDGRKWCVEHIENNNSVKIKAESMNQSVYVYKCSNSQITIQGKVNCITLDTCKKICISFEDIVSSFEVLNSERIIVQPLGKLPTAVIDKSDGILIYLSQNSCDVEVISSKSSEINIALPDGQDGYNEKPVPEQLKTTVVNGALVTVPVEKM